MGVQQVPAGGQLVSCSGQVPGRRMRRVAADLGARGRCRVQDLGGTAQRDPRVERRTRSPGAAAFRRAWLEFARQGHVTQVAGQGGDEAVEFPDHADLRVVGQLVLG